MNRRAALFIVALTAIGCANNSTCKVRESAMPDAQNVLSNAPTLLPQMPVTTTGATRGQIPEPPRPLNPDAAAADPAKMQVAVRIRAHVNGAPILEEELREAMVMRTGELLNVPETQRAAYFQEMTGRELDRLIERELILLEMMNKIKELKRPQLLDQLKLEASKEGDRRIKDIRTASKAKTDEEFRAMLAQQGLSVEGLRRQTERNFMMTEYIRNMIYPVVQRISLQQIKEYYEEHPDEFQLADRVKWLDIFIDSSRFPTAAAARQHAEEIHNRAKNGEDFIALAKEFDNGDSILRNGEGLGTQRGDIKPPQAEPVVFALKPGEVGPIIDLGFGLHIVKVVERDYAGVQPFDVKCQTKIRDKLRNQIAEREYRRIVDDMKRKATVVIHQ
jgi:parvulin-like peptidyl-prolyl isomerase